MSTDSSQVSTPLDSEQLQDALQSNVSEQVEPQAAASDGAHVADVTKAATEAEIKADSAASAKGSTEDAGDATGDAVQHRIKSFVIRAGRMTQAQTKALEQLGPKYLVDVSALEHLNFDELFGRKAPLVVEIGFGMGRSFIEMAAKDPLSNYLGIEVHPPGVGATLLLIDGMELKNVRLIQYDAFEILKKCIAPESIDALQIFFPDPWPKARHHKRRLINPAFLELVTPLLKHGGEIRMATDWENYAEQMLACLTEARELVNTAPDGGYTPRPAWRPVTKFEQRGENLGHGVWDLVFKRV